MASKGKLSSPAKTRCGNIESGIEVIMAKVMKEVPAITTKMGIVKDKPINKSPNVRRIVIKSLVTAGHIREVIRSSVLNSYQNQAVVLKLCKKPTNYEQTSLNYRQA
jgi:hypothetical protein